MPRMTEEAWRDHAASTHTKQNSWWLNDAKGIPCSRVCDEPGCIEAVKARYKPGVFDVGGYEDAIEEIVEPEDY